MKWRAPIWPRLWQGVATWNEWRARKPKCRVKLHYGVLCGAILRQANLHHASLCSADLRGSDLRQASAELTSSGANLTAAGLGVADLGGAYIAATVCRCRPDHDKASGTAVTKGELAELSHLQRSRACR